MHSRCQAPLPPFEFRERRSQNLSGSARHFVHVPRTRRFEHSCFCGVESSFPGSTGARGFLAPSRRRTALTLIIDSFAWIEFLTGGLRGPTVRRHFESGDHLVTPDLVLAEVARKFGGDGQPRNLVEGHLRAMVALSDVEPVT